MPVIDIFSRRKQDSKQSAPSTLVYDRVPVTVRNQIIHIWNASIGAYVDVADPYFLVSSHNNKAWDNIHNTLCREKGLLRLSKSRQDHRVQCMEYLSNQQNVDDALDIIEISFREILELRYIDRYRAEEMGITQSPGDAIDELNFRFKDANLGYQFESGQIIRTDNFATHEEVVKPALSLLSDPQFSGAEIEFLAALKHYRGENYRDSITAANSAFESTLKTICKIKKWTYDQRDSAGRLLQIARQNGLFPEYMGTSFDQLISTLKSGLIPIRNRESSSHGQGPEPKNPPSHVAEYALNLCAAQILFLVKSMKETTK